MHERPLELQQCSDYVQGQQSLPIGSCTYAWVPRFLLHTCHPQQRRLILVHAIKALENPPNPASFVQLFLVTTHLPPAPTTAIGLCLVPGSEADAAVSTPVSNRSSSPVPAAVVTTAAVPNRPAVTRFTRDRRSNGEGEVFSVADC